MFFDSHAHYDDERFDEDRNALLPSMQENGVDYIINVGADLPTSRKALEIAEKYSFVFAAAGVHPHDADSLDDVGLAELTGMLEHPRVVALGEIGLDYHYDNSPRDLQKYWFEQQARLAVSCGLPVIIHDREAHGDCMEIIRRVEGLQGVMHCYSGSAEMAKELVKLGFYISFSGSVTFKNAKNIAEAVRVVPDDRLLIETDCPYLAPVPHRGERNSSLLLHYTAERIAALRGTSVEEVARLSMENTFRLFQKAVGLR